MPGSDPAPGADLYVRSLDDLVEGRHRNGLHRLAVDRPTADVAGALAVHAWRTLSVTVGPDSGKGGVIAGLAAAGGFPEWVGANWDALQDALRDLSWAPAQGYAVIIDGWADLVESSGADARQLASVLHSSAQWWDEQSVPFHALLR